ncbi:hypothetical protein [Candidatus Parabeggiatoa sp. HSG14]|uniref:hypothetical protein n=1 Tax=Candidatus Parabeggiatoa sp. HSG14 TaxID=3055593 RepID=UPI0025A6C34E|nr:hypothetical protein [Thiotrichales bacterium HSG14]
MNIKILVTIIMSAFFVVNSVADTIDFSTDQNIDTGVGFDTLQSKVRGDCVEISEPKQVVNVSGQEVVFSLVQIEDSLSLNQHLQISASASLKASVFGASGKANLSRSVKVNDYSIYALASVFVRNNAYRMRNVKLKPDTYKLYAEDKERFRNRCGDTFVSGYITGGEFHSIIEIKTNNKTEKRSFSSELTGSYGIFSGSATFKQKLERIAKKNRIHVYVMHTGGTGEIVNITPEKMVTQATKFPKTVESDKARPVLATIQSYETLKLPAGITPVDRLTQQEVILELARLSSYAQKQLANIEYILFHPKEFKKPNIQSLNKAANLTRTLLNTVRRTARACYRNVKTCVLPASLKLSSVNFPERYASIVEACKNPIYKEKADPICGVKLYALGRGKECGVELYNLGYGKSCGAKTYKNGAGAVCGVELYRLTQNEVCGTDTVKIKNTSGSWWDNLDLIAKECIRAGGKVSVIHCIIPKTCRHSANGVEKYKTCRNAAFGVEEYNSCRLSAFGIERYIQCRHPTFGVAEYNSCRKPQFGFEKCAK